MVDRVKGCPMSSSRATVVWRYDSARVFLAALLLFIFAECAAGAAPVTAKAENVVWYKITADHGPMGLAHGDPFIMVPPAVMWSNFFAFRTPILAPMNVTGFELVTHNVAPHPGEPAPFGPYLAGATATPPAVGSAIRTGTGAG